MAPQQPDLSNPVVARRLARIISFALLVSVGTFAVIVAMLLSRGTMAMGEADYRQLHTVALMVNVTLVVVATLIGVRMHMFTGPVSERAARTYRTHVIAAALCEGATFFGLVVVMLNGSWHAALPAAVGAIGLVTSVLRGEIRFSALVDEARAE